MDDEERNKRLEKKAKMGTELEQMKQPV